MVSAVVGRETELEAVEHFLDSLPGPGALVIDGEAGIGKTTLWLEGVRAAEARSFRVLSARPSESEARLSYAALADLVGVVVDETQATLPAPQRQALEIALLRVEAKAPADPRTTATALAGVLGALARHQSVLVAIDDVQWLDPASARALEFAARRLPPNVGLLVTRRGSHDDEAPLGLRRALAEGRLQRLLPGPLSLAALHHLISGRLGTAPSRRSLIRIADASAGNPFFALELARALAGEQTVHQLGDPLPIPASLEQLVLARMHALPAVAQEAVLVAAVLSRPTAATVAQALSPGEDVDAALIAAEEAGVLVSERERIRFTHPLLASAVYGAASHSRRRQLHGQLAEIAADPEERARHLAASVTEPEEATAQALEDAAVAAATRGAHDAAAELFDAASRLTPSAHAEALGRRLLGQAWALYTIGDLAAAGSVSLRAVTDAETPSVRVQGLLLLANMDWEAGAVEAAVERLQECLLAAAGDRDQQGEVYALLAQQTVPIDPQRALEHFDAAEQLLSEERTPDGLTRVCFHRLLTEAMLGRVPRPELLERGLELEEAPVHPGPLIWFTCIDDFDSARARHGVEHEFFQDDGDERSTGDRLAYRAVVELRAGEWSLAEECADRACAIVENLDAGRAYAVAFGWRSLVDAHRGRLERARSTLQPLLEEADRAGMGSWWTERLLSIRGYVEFTAGDHEAADRALTQMWERYDSLGVVEPLLDWSEPFHIESLVALGELDRARETLARLEERGRTFPRLWIDATLPRARALVRTAEGDPPAALAALEELDVAAAARLPFELASALLLKGRLLRRVKQRRSASASLREALEIFERLGAPTWAEQTRGELARVGPRRRAHDELTATERRVAELAASGLTNLEVAKAAFVSPKTVEANLARVYRKLGIHSRAELGARIRDSGREADVRTEGNA